MSGFKDDALKARFDLIPARPLRALAELFTKGAGKYSARNWEVGMRYGRVFSAMMRHAWAWWGGEEYDKEGQHHLDSVMWCAMVLREYVDTHPECDDRAPKTPKNDRVVREINAELAEDAEKKFVKRKPRSTGTRKRKKARKK